MRPRFYLDVVGDVVVAKRAAGPDPAGQLPAPLPSWEEVTPAIYRRVRLLWERQPDGTFAPPSVGSDPVRGDTPEEALARKEAALRAALAALDARVTALEQV